MLDIKTCESDKILSEIVDAFSRIEVQDVRVGKVKMPYEVYNKLMTDSKFGSHYYENEGFVKTAPMTPGEDRGSLWGAKLELTSNRFEVVSDMEVLRYPWHQHSTEQGSFLVEQVSLWGAKMSTIRKNLIVCVKSRSRPIRDINNSEWTAIETLREMITEVQYRKYIRDGFLLVKGAQSGLIYQIFRNSTHTKIWDKGKVTKEVCVRIKDQKIPPTDNVIAFKSIIESNELEFQKLGNVYNMAS